MLNQLSRKNVFPAGALVAVAAAGLLVGCGRGDESPDMAFSATPPRTARVDLTPFQPTGLAGLPVQPIEDPERIRMVVANRAGQFGRRTNPFALLPEEQAFDVRQATERIFAQGGGFGMFYTPPPEVVEAPPVVEPQPYRRLSGVVVGDSILAIIDMGDGRGSQIIRPGQRIPNSEWRVASIDQERAVLRRDGNRLPREVIVRLETLPGGVQGTGPAGGAAPGPAGGPMGGSEGEMGGRGGGRQGGQMGLDR
jgi:hypothetical protein